MLFEELTLTLNEELTRRYGYDAYKHAGMISHSGAVQAAKHFLKFPKINYGLNKLKELDHLEASIENLALQHQFSGLFSRDEIANAVRILAQLGFTPRPIESSELLSNRDTRN